MTLSLTLLCSIDLINSSMNKVIQTFMAIITSSTLLLTSPSASGQVSSTDMETILYYASLAPSSHNTQPWRVRIKQSTIWIEADSSRQLKVVDPDYRGLFISLGAFIENICLASGSLGYKAQVHLPADSQPFTIKIRLIAERKTGFDLSQMEKRRTLRTPYDTTSIRENDLARLLKNTDGDVHYFAANTNTGAFIGHNTLYAYSQQANNAEAKDELAQWIRFSAKEATESRDGLSTASMGINGISRFLVSNFFKPADSKKQSFVDKGIKNTQNLIEHAGGWLLITQPKNTPEAWIRTGRLYQRVNLACRDLSIGMHPMNQMIEETNFNMLAVQHVQLSGYIQFVARIGYVSSYPDKSSLRRPVDSFVIFE